MATKHLSLNQIAYNMIRQKIVNGEFEPGCRIREDYLAEEIAMSRTPVREAINRLVSDGLIINKARKGLYLINPTDKEIAHYLDIRIALEQLAIEKCIETIEPTGLEQLREELATFQEHLTRGEYDTCNQLDGEFHLAIAKLSGNAKLYTMLNELSSFFLQTRSWEKKIHPKEKNEATLAEHTTIVAAIEQKDAEAAKRAIRTNIETMRQNLQLP